MKMSKLKYLISIFVLGLAFTGCEQLQGTLHDDMVEELKKNTGDPSVSSSVFYYNGTSSEDMTSSSNHYLEINFGRKITAKKISGGFKVSYTDKTTNKPVAVDLDLNGGMVSDDMTGYLLDMSPVFKFLDGGNTARDGLLSVAVKASGFVCNEGDQLGRATSSFESTIAVKPLYSKTSGVKVLTNNAPSSFLIPTNSEISLSDSAYLTTSGSVPSGVKFELGGVSSDKKSIIVNVAEGSIKDKIFDATFDISGIKPVTSGIAYKKSLGLTFTDGIPKSPITLNLSDLTESPSPVNVSSDEFLGLTNISKFTIALSTLTGSGWDNACIAIDGVWAANCTWGGNVAITDSDKIASIIKNGFTVYGSKGGSCTVTISW